MNPPSAQEIAEKAACHISHSPPLAFHQLTSVIVSAITAAVAGSEQFWMNAFREFRIALRQALFEKGLMTNPGSADDDLIAMVRSLAVAQAKEEETHSDPLGERCWNACCLQGEQPKPHDTYPFAIWERCNLLVKALELKEPASDNVNAVLQNVRYLAALEHARSTFNEILTIHWGHDGDCGANRLANDGFDVVDNALKTALSEHSNAAGAGVSKTFRPDTCKICGLGVADHGGGWATAKASIPGLSDVEKHEFVSK